MVLSEKIKVGVVGVGYLGKLHARIYSESEAVQLVGVADTDKGRAEEIARQTGSKPFVDYSELFGKVNAVSIAVPSGLHYRVASDFLNQGIDILIEKPITDSIADAEGLVRMAGDRDLILQVGHIERFNPGYIALKGLVHKPMFIDAQRLSPFTERGTDVDVTIDLMIHDIDIILSLVKSDISEIKATGMPMLTPRIDMASARIEFKNGCIANITAGRIFHGKTRRIRVFEEENYLSLDYQTTEIIEHKKKLKDGRPTQDIKHIKPEKFDPLKEELNAFVQSVRKRTKPVISGIEATEALKVALKVSEIINENTHS